MSQLPPLTMLKTSTAKLALPLLEAGNYHQALQVFRQVPESDRSLDDWVNQAVCLLHLNQPETALQVCDRVLSLAADHPQAWLFKGVALHRLNRYDEAYACYAKASGESDQTATTAAKKPWYRRWQSLKNGC
ncbi:MAG: tetratricopeptide repeat protein [Leptolyngbya sp. SIOISBB]|nr:tetratricopeptide repeat protein [Leptolyngbya sp. SIOISBB]